MRTVKYRRRSLKCYNDQVHEKVQDGMRDQVELMVAHAKTTAVASSEEMACKIAQAIGITQGVESRPNR